jgi:hypothetical protein
MSSQKLKNLLILPRKRLVQTATLSLANNLLVLILLSTVLVCFATELLLL